MAYVKKIILHLCMIGLLHNAYCTEDTKSKEEELVESESKDGKLEIIKQIKRVNDDGSYTIGYEADDGTFKIESRDVLGNIKGTYGYIDDQGEIKRVSYSTTNSSELLNNKPEPTTSSVVQRIPKQNKTSSFTTKRPGVVYSTTQSTPTTPRRRTTYSTTSTTSKPNYSDVINVESQLSRTTTKPAHIVYATSAPPRILLQSRAGPRSTLTPHVQHSEGQLSRPETLSDLPLFKRLALKNPLLEESLSKPVVEESQIRSNILRRQLSPNKGEFDPHQHVFNLQQALGDDSTDVYSASVTTGTPRPLFTTTLRPRILSSTTVQPVAVPRPNFRYVNYQRGNPQEEQSDQNGDYNQEASSTEASGPHTTPTPIPIVQIPANRSPTPEPLVAIRHPFQKGTILIPLSQLQGRLLPIELNDNLQPDYNRNHHQNQQYSEQYFRETTTPNPTEEPKGFYVRRLPPPQLRPIPVHVDENGYIRDLPPQQVAIPTPYPLPVPVTPSPKQVNNDITNEIDNITPPVSTKDFQRLLQFLIMRQKKLELARDLALRNLAPQPEYHQQYNQAYQPTLPPYYVPRRPEQNNGPVQFLPAPSDSQQRGRYLPHPTHAPQHPQNVIIRPQPSHHQSLYNPDPEVTATPQSYVPTRRVARLLNPGDPRQQQVNEEYLPPDVREMLLLKMLQLAINPALPVDVEEEVEESTAEPRYKKVPVRNVEILGEEADEEEDKRARRSKRYRDNMEYYE